MSHVLYTIRQDTIEEFCRCTQSLWKPDATKQFRIIFHQRSYHAFAYELSDRKSVLAGDAYEAMQIGILLCLFRPFALSPCNHPLCHNGYTCRRNSFAAW